MADYRKVDVEHELRRELEEARAEIERLRNAERPADLPVSTKEALWEIEKLKQQLQVARTIRSKALVYFIPAWVLALGLTLNWRGCSRLQHAGRATHGHEALPVAKPIRNMPIQAKNETATSDVEPDVGERTER
jgi:hypothetical protein